MGAEGSHHKNEYQENRDNFNNTKLSLFPADIVTKNYLEINRTKSHPKSLY